MRLAPLETRSASTGARRPVTPELLASTFLAPRAAPYGLAEALADVSAPWSASLALASDEVTRLIEQALRDLAVATPGLTVDALDLSRLPNGRARDHLLALKELWQRLGDALPEDLVAARHALRSGEADALEALPVTSWPCAFETRAEMELREHLVGLFGEARDETSPVETPGALGHVQRHLLGAASPVPKDDTMEIYGLRDPRAEVAFAAARAQALVAGGMVPEDIGILVPDDQAYLGAMPSAFERLGLHLSGMPATGSQRDHLGEFLASLLAALKVSAPRMALADLALSPLLPLDLATRHRIADEFASRGWSKSAKDSAAAPVFAELHPAKSPGQLLAKLVTIAGLLADKEKLLPRINSLRPLLIGEEIDWTALSRATEPSPGPSSAGDRFVEGIAVFGENALPWRPVRHLVVLGLAGANWPRPVPGTPFFTESELALIEATTGISLPSRGAVIARRLELFRRQLSAATQSATLTVPARDLDGKGLAPSTALFLVARALGHSKVAEIIVDPHADCPAIAKFHSRAVEWHADHLAAILPESGEITVALDPFHIHLDEEGAPKPQSPTRLETMLVSPLAWLLGELGAEDRTWAPERLDVMTLGTIVHAALETLFPAGERVPSGEELEASIGPALHDAIAREARWLEEPAWAIERANLLREVGKAAHGWSRFLLANGAKIRAVETWLRGDHPVGIAIRGKSDCLVDLPDGRIIVVDHKRSSSSARRTRMEAGADLQVELYRVMIALSAEFDGIARERVVPAYHCTLDGRILAGPEGVGLVGARTLGGDIGGSATRLLEERVAHLLAGRVPLNLGGDLA
jgi:hypothetical protein